MPSGVPPTSGWRGSPVPVLLATGMSARYTGLCWAGPGWWVVLKTISPPFTPVPPSVTLLQTFHPSDNFTQKNMQPL